MSMLQNLLQHIMSHHWKVSYPPIVSRHLELELDTLIIVIAQFSAILPTGNSPNYLQKFYFADFVPDTFCNTQDKEKNIIHINQEESSCSPLWIIEWLGGSVDSWRPSVVVGDRQITREGIRTENIREATLYIVTAEVARREENSYLKVLKMCWIYPYLQISSLKLWKSLLSKIDHCKGKSSLIE